MRYTTQRSPGGACCVRSTELVPIQGSGDPHQSIVSPSGISKLIKRIFGISPVANIAGGGGGGGEFSCPPFIGIVTEIPGTVRKIGQVDVIKVYDDGTYQTPSSMKVLFPDL